MTRNRRKIRRGMSSQEAIRALSAGNREAETICQTLFNRAPYIDPEDFLEGWGPLRDLDSLGIWGSRIVRLYKDVCNEDPRAMLAVLRAWQLVIDDVTSDVINHAIDQGERINIDAVMRAVQAELPLFNAA
jgi:hypothetical protein